MGDADVPLSPVWRPVAPREVGASRPPFRPGRLTFDDLWYLELTNATHAADGVPALDEAPAAATQVAFRVGAGQAADLDVLEPRSGVRSVVVTTGQPRLSVDLPQVEELFVLSRGRRFDTEVLRHLPNLRTLVVGATSGVPLPEALTAATPRLQNLQVRWQLLTPVEALGRLPVLTRLWLSSAKGGVRSLDSCERLSWLHCAGGLAAGWGQLTSLRDLRHVRMVPGSLADLRVVGSWPRLASLDVGGHGVRSLAGLERAGELRDLVLREVGTADLGPLAALTGLRRLAVVGHASWRPDLSPIGRLSGLRSLRVELGDLDAPGEVASLDFLPDEAPELVEVALPTTAVRDGRLERLRRYPRLRSVQLYGNYGEQEALLRRALPHGWVDVLAGPRAGGAATVDTVGGLVIRRIGEQAAVYSVFQDARAIMAASSNHEAADRMTALLRSRAPHLADQVTVDSEASGVGITSPSLDRLREFLRIVTAGRDQPG